MFALPIVNQPLLTIIQTMLAPALMISGCALLLSGINNKYSLVVTRIRVLDEEKRQLCSAMVLNKAPNHAHHRLKSIDVQMNHFRSRVALVRNAVICYCIAIAFFVLASLTVGVTFTRIGNSVDSIVLILFFMGMTMVLCGVIFAVKEMVRGYQIITIEMEDTVKMFQTSPEEPTTHTQS